MAEKMDATLKLSNGSVIPRIGLGSGTTGMDFKEAMVPDIKKAIEDAVDAGYRHFDTAALYRTELPLGQAIQVKIDNGAVRREDVYITTKLWNTNHRPERVEPALRQSLKNLNMDYVDLYLIHSPVAYQPSEETVPMDSDGKVLHDNDVDLMDTWKAMEACQKKGLAKSVGVSNFTCRQLQRVLDICEVRPVVNQIECHPFCTSEKLVGFCLKNNVAVVCFCPIGGQLYHRAAPEERGEFGIIDNKILEKIGEKYSKTAAQVFDFKLSDEEIETIFQMNRNHRFYKSLVDPRSVGSKENPFVDDEGQY